MTSAAYADFKRSGIVESDFFNFQRATEYWEEMKTREDLMEAVRVCESGPYGRWEEVFLKDDREALAALESREEPEAEEIRSCYDLQMTFFVFDNMYTSWRTGRSFRAEPFNENRGLMACTAMATINVFTGDCNDMPDWRQPANRIKDQRVLERYQERQARRGE